MLIPFSRVPFPSFNKVTLITEINIKISVNVAKPIINIFFSKNPFVLIGYIYLRLNLIYLNPLWAMFGYIIYRDANKEIVITNISREVLRHKEKLKGYYISNDIFVAHKKDN